MTRPPLDDACFNLIDTLIDEQIIESENVDLFEVNRSRQRISLHYINKNIELLGERITKSDIRTLIYDYVNAFNFQNLSEEEFRVDEKRVWREFKNLVYGS